MKNIQIACFITPHGFGHATRTIAVLEALQKRSPDVHPLLFTTVPESLFADTLSDFSYHSLACDIGLIQENSMNADIPATINRLQEFMPFDRILIEKLTKTIAKCSLVLCDIAPLGIAVAKEAAIPSVLLENFTWDWIYKAYLPHNPGIQPFIESFTRYYNQADIHIRTQPFCGDSVADMVCDPIFRCIRTQRQNMRDKLCSGNQKMVLVTMGGIDLSLPFVNMLTNFPETFFVLAGQKNTHQLAENVLQLSRDSNIYHPDLINAADLVVCKSGYSTVAECVQAGVPIATVGRTIFPESPILEHFCQEKLNGKSFSQKEFLSGRWLNNMQQLCSVSRTSPAQTNGADTVAELLLGLL